MNIDYSREYLEQQHHERMRAWMHDKGWSTSMCADPADIFEIKELIENEDDDSIDNLNYL